MHGSNNSSDNSSNNKRYLYYSTSFSPILPSYRLTKYTSSYVNRFLRLLSSYERERISYWLNYNAKVWPFRRNRYNFAGFSHNQGYLKLVYIPQAIVWNRIPVIHPMLLDLRHNFLQPASQEWESYYDLSASSIRYEDGRIVPLPYIHSKAFFPLLRENPDSVLVTNNLKEISQEDNQQHKIIIWKTKSALPLRPKIQNPKFEILLSETNEIRKIGDDIARQLGNDFYVLKYRYPDSWDHNWGRFKQAYVEHLNIDLLVRKLPAIVPSGSNLYVMSNIWKQPDYFAKLRKLYRLFTYNDFPALRKLIETKSPNSFLLLVIENYFAKQATRWIKVDRLMKDLA